MLCSFNNVLSYKHEKFIEQNVIVVAPDPNYPPFEFLDHNGEYIGLVRDFLDIISQKLNLDIRYVYYNSFQDVLEAAQRSQIDILPSVIKTPEREKYLLFTEPYISVPNVIITRKDIEISKIYPSNLYLFEKVGVQSGYAVGDYLREKYNLTNIVCSDYPEVLLRNLSLGQLDIVVGNLATMSFFIDELNLTNLKVIGDVEYNDILSFGITKNNKTLLDIMNVGLSLITKEEKDIIKRYWISIQLPTLYDYQQFWYILLFISIIGFLMILLFYILYKSLEKKFKQTKEDFIEVEKQLSQAQKMEAIGVLAAGVAHDFNNLLSIVSMNTELLSRKTNDYYTQKKLEDMKSVVKKGTYLVQQLLLFSRKYDEQSSLIDLKNVINNMMLLIQTLMPKVININFTYDENIEYNVFADASQIEQIILNMASNTKDAIELNGNFNIKLDIVDVYNHNIIKKGKYVLLSVSDDGSGIPEDIRNKIFDPFFTTKEIGKGSGLGLSSAFGIIKRHKGYIFCESEIGKGTTFNIYLQYIH